MEIENDALRNKQNENFLPLHRSKQITVQMGIVIGYVCALCLTQAKWNLSKWSK